ncbi:SEL1-like repeat protein [Burkholderia gladioli]|uniref:SEL1-like repeat protein n=1 Tax=Burkholderia gladioli TaxID=28095 RepID=UPI001FC82677|nr:DUF6396 domain-containing protein [Burkholderia gladioli]
MSILPWCRISLIALSAFAASVHAALLPTPTTERPVAMSDLPRYEKLPLFNPHRTTFTCVYQDQHVPPVDPQAELWFQQALALDNPDVDYQKRDYPKIYQLYVQAADRGNWKAMLNLASLILSSYPGVPEHDPEVAIQWVEKAMRLGVPDAYDMMGTYHQNGRIKGGNATSAFAFFQRAADMGSPSALAFLGEKLDASHDDPDEGFWGNLPVATQMLECALAQGYGDAAEELGFVYARSGTAQAKRRALEVLHEGVKLGSAKCATKLSIEFDGFNLADGRNLPGAIDSARAQRYRAISRTLEHYRGRIKLPNLDKVLPLPPAALPKWDGNVQTLIDGAKPVTPAPKLQQGAAQQGREFVQPGYAVASLDTSTISVAGNQVVPRDGYWLALYGAASAEKSQLIPARGNMPERYHAGERFEASPLSWLTADQVQWHYLGDAYPLPPQREDFLKHMIEARLLRQVPELPSRLICGGQQQCPQSGIWEARVVNDHALARPFNRWNQQTFVEKGQVFPQASERFPGLAMNDVRWTYLGSPNAETGMPGIREISL